jgi:hypothetical protein
MKKILVIVILLLTYRTFSVGASTSFPNETSKKIALTFDACMTTGMLKRIASGADQQLYNAEIAEFLKQEKIQATIFITGLWAENYRARVAKTQVRICKKFLHSRSTNNLFWDYFWERLFTWILEYLLTKCSYNFAD